MKRGKGRGAWVRERERQRILKIGRASVFFLNLASPLSLSPPPLPPIQVWRLATGFLYMGPLNFNWLFNLVWL